MENNKSILIVVPARGGSKGIKLKNIRLLGGRPLVALTGEIASKVPGIDRAIVSTDSKEIADVAASAGLDVPFLRPEELSGDLISDVDVLTHALIAVEEIDNKRYDIVVMLQPTSPFRTVNHVTKAIRKLVEGGYDSVVTVSKSDSKLHPLKQFIINDGLLSFYDKDGENIIARQQLNTLYHRNGVAYAMTRDCLINQKSIFGKNSAALVLNEVLINIDDEIDLEFANYYYDKYLN